MILCSFVFAFCVLEFRFFSRILICLLWVSLGDPWCSLIPNLGFFFVNDRCIFFFYMSNILILWFPISFLQKKHPQVKTGWGWDFNCCFKIGMGVHTLPRPRFGRGWEWDRGVLSKTRPIAIPIHSLYIITKTPICDPNHTFFFSQVSGFYLIWGCTNSYYGSKAWCFFHF